jgi:hypothetical protein
MRYLLPRISRKTRAEKKMSTSRLRYDYAGKAVPAGSVVAEPRGTDDYPGSRAEVELTAHDSTDLVESSDDGDDRLGHHHNRPGTDRGTEVGPHLHDAGLTEDRSELGILIVSLPTLASMTAVPRRFRPPHEESLRPDS